MTLYKPVWVQPASGDADIDYPMLELRLAIQALIGSGNVRGILGPSGAVVKQRSAGANFSVDVQPFQAAIVGEDVADQGTYLTTLTSVFNVVTPSAPASGSRTHRLVAQIRDKRSNASWSTYDWTPLLLQDTGSGTPSRPASSLNLALITIAAGQSSVTNTNIAPNWVPLRTSQILNPVTTSQINPASWNNTGTWNDFSSGNWPAITFTVPPSGIVKVTINGNILPSGGKALLGWRVSGTDTVANSSTGSWGSAADSRGGRVTYVSGLTPGGTDTVTPGWNQFGSGSSDGGDGDLTVEFIQ